MHDYFYVHDFEVVDLDWSFGCCWFSGSYFDLLQGRGAFTVSTFYMQSILACRIAVLRMRLRTWLGAVINIR